MARLLGFLETGLFLLLPAFFTVDLFLEKDTLLWPMIGAALCRLGRWLIARKYAVTCKLKIEEYYTLYLCIGLLVCLLVLGPYLSTHFTA